MKRHDDDGGSGGDEVERCSRRDRKMQGHSEIVCPLSVFQGWLVIRVRRLGEGCNKGSVLLTRVGLSLNETVYNARGSVVMVVTAI